MVTIQDRINELKEKANSKGFRLTVLDRGQNFKKSYLADRYEFWLEGHWFDSKIVIASTLEELYEKGVPVVMEIMRISESGRLNDPME